MASLLGESIIHPSDLSAPHRLHQDVATKEHEDEKVMVEALKKEMEDEKALVEDLKKELKVKRREALAWQIRMWNKIFELNKVDFARTMDKAWFTNEIMIMRCMKDPDPSRKDLRKKAIAFNKQIDAAVSLGLEGYMFGPSKKREASSVKEEEEASDEEELRDLKMYLEEAILQMVEADRDEFRERGKIIYRRARPFAKVAARETYLSSVVQSLHDREEREPVLPTVIEILGYMLLEEIAASPRSSVPSLTANTAKMRNTRTLASIRGEKQHEAPPKIEVTIMSSLYSVFDQRSFEEKVESDHEYAMKKCNDDVEEIKRMIAKAEEWIEIGTKSALEIYPNVLNQMAVKRPFESQLVVFCGDLSDMRYGRWLHPLSHTETQKLNEIRVLARKAIDKYTQAKGPGSLPRITEPVLPTFCTTHL